MPSISDRLKSLSVSIGTQNIKPPKPRTDGEFSIDNVLAGDFWHTPGGVTHGIRTEDIGAVVLDIFSPPRAEYKKTGDGFGQAKIEK